MIVFVDFDGTLHNESVAKFDLWTEPNENVVEAIKQFKEAGHEIVIYSCRSNPEICPEKYEEVMYKWLKKFDVPFDRIEPNKPYFDLLIDDRSIHPDRIEK